MRPEDAFAAEAPPPEVPGYVLLGPLGAGAMGTVWRARARDGRRVAVKVLRRAAEGDGAGRRFAREVETARAIDHPHAVRVLDAGRLADERPFLVMELVDGSPLGEVMALGALGPRALAETLAKVARALAAAHAVGVVHRDVKPSNVLLDAALEPRLVDFGLASFVHAQGELTRTGAAVGTPRYMAPEVLTGGSRRAGPRSDVFALGVMLYEGLAGRHPFEAPDLEGLCQQLTLCRPPPPPGEPALVECCLWALEREPGRRPTAAQLATALDAAAERDPEVTPISAVGEVLGDYVVERLLDARGARAVGRHAGGARHALEVLAVDPGAAGEARRARLARAAQALVGLEHPARVRLHGWRVLPDGRAYLAHDLLEGPTLAARAAEAPLALAQALALGATLAEALARLHARGVVHRAVAPGNVHLGGPAGVVLGGVELVLDEGAERVTRASQIVGDPAALAPEQALGRAEQQGPATDVYGLGVTLYVALTGGPPFEASHFAGLLRALATQEPPPLRAARPDAPAALEALLAECLARDPADRPSAAEAGAALRALAAGRRPPLTRAQRGARAARARRAGGVGGVVLALVALVAASGYGLRAVWGERGAEAARALSAGAAAAEALEGALDEPDGAAAAASVVSAQQALARVEAARDRLGPRRTELTSAAARLEAALARAAQRAERARRAEGHLAEAAARAAARDLAGALQAVRAAVAADPARAARGPVRVAAALSATGSSPGGARQALATVAAVASVCGVPLPAEAAPLELALAEELRGAVAAAEARAPRAAAPEAELLAALGRALALDPAVVVPPPLAAAAVDLARRRLARGDGALALEAAAVATAAAPAQDALEPAALAALARAGELELWARAQRGWPARYLRARALAALARADPARAAAAAEALAAALADALPAAAAARLEVDRLELTARADPAAALAAARELLGAAPPFPEAWQLERLVARAHLARGEPAAAVAAAERSVQGLRRRLEESWTRELPPGARAATSTELGPAYATLIEALLAAGRAAEARAHLDDARIAPLLQGASQRLEALYWERRGRPRRALAHAEAYLARHPHDRDARALVERLRTAAEPSPR